MTDFLLHDWLRLGLASLAGFVIGGVWYAPGVFGTRWAALAGLSRDRLEGGAWAWCSAAAGSSSWS